MAIPETVENTFKLIDGLRKIDLKGLLQKPGLGDLHFGALIEHLSTFLFILKIVEKDALKQLPNSMVEELEAALSDLTHRITSIGRIQIGDQNFHAMREEIIRDFPPAVRTFLQRVNWILLSLVIWNFVHDERKQEINGIKNTLNQQIEFQKNAFETITSEMVSKQKQSMKELDKIIEDARKAGGSIGVSSFANEFSRDTTILASQAKKWLSAAIILSIVTIAFAGIAPFVTPILENFGVNTEFMKEASGIPIISSKIVIAAVLIAATMWCARTYKTIKHQQTITNHRARALETFKAFWNSSDEPDIKNAVLLETMRSIFAIASPGYIASGDDSPDSSTRIIEIVKGLSQTTKN
jgi:chemotaxis protein CheY-P-specific phosphatase CheC